MKLRKLVAMFGVVVSGSLALGGCLSNASVELVESEFNSSAELLAATNDSVWRKPKPENLMLMTLENGNEILFELAPQFAPKHVKNISGLVKRKYFDDLFVIRSQDNYVAQWGDPYEETNAKPLGDVLKNIDMEFFRKLSEVSFSPIQSNDAYAEKVGFVGGFPVSADSTQAWLTHCYGMLGVSRGLEADSGNGAGLYMVTGHAPRHLDRNVTLVGRAIVGHASLSSLPRGTGPLGFYETEQEYVKIISVKMGNDIADDKLNIELMRTDTTTFQEYVALRATRNESWFRHPTGRISLCNVSVPSRVSKP